MSPTSNKGTVQKLFGWTVAIVLLLVSTWVWFERQFVVDALQYYQYKPSSQIKSITKRLELTDKAKFMFYASNPSVETSKTFNIYCKRQEASSPILGCYSNKRIHIYDITDERLDGIQEVTAAHELLHAEYERLSNDEKQHLQPLLEAAYQKVANEELKQRMAYYDRTQPGEKYNELHSILPTEYGDIGSTLENYYHKYFKNRNNIVQQHKRVSMQFEQIEQEAKTLAARIDALTETINSNIQRYNSGIAALNQKVTIFNAKADRGEFTSQAEFNVQRALLENERSQFETLKAQITADTNLHTELVAQYEAINARANSLNKSIDSVLADEPEL